MSAALLALRRGASAPSVRSAALFLARSSLPRSCRRVLQQEVRLVFRGGGRGGRSVGGSAVLAAGAARLCSAATVTASPDAKATVIEFTKAEESSQPGLLSSFYLVLVDVFAGLRTLLRALHLTVICAPLFALTPLALWSPGRFLDAWFDLLVSTLERCGPVSVKLGQWAATRRDLFPAELCRRLAKLQRRTLPHPWRKTDQTLRCSLGMDYAQKTFSRFDREPIGSGCCAQVYRATLRSPPGKEVAVKVLHPGVEALFDRDLRVMSTFVRVAKWLFPSLEYLSLNESIREFRKMMTGQVDLRREAGNLDAFHRNFRDHPGVSFPEPVLELSDREVLVESFEEGQHMGEFVESLLRRKEGSRRAARKEVAAAGVEMLLKMVFEDNFVHGDLHPGNILVRDENAGSMAGGKKLVILDPGIVASLSEKDLHYFKGVFKSVVVGDGRQVGRLFLENSEHQCQDREAFVREMEHLVLSARGQQLSLSRVDVSDLMARLLSVLRRHRVKLEANYASVVLAIMVLEGLGRTLDPDLDLIAKAAPYLLLPPRSSLNDEDLTSLL